MTTIEQRPAAYETIEFDHNSGVEPALHYFELFKSMKHLPFFRSTVGPVGHWVFTDLDIIRDAYQSPDLLSSSAIVPTQPDPPYFLIPEMVDPPLHTKYRQLLSPRFSPGTIAALEDKVRARCIALLEPLAERGSCDFVKDFGSHYPTTVFMDLMGLPLSEFDQFMEWEDAILHLTHEDDPDGSRAYAAQVAVMEYFKGLIVDRRQDPTDDLTSFIVNGRLDGELLAEQDILFTLLLMFMAGLDTVTQQLAYSFLHLATHPEDRRRIVEHPEIIPDAVEEFLRAYAIVVPGRKATRDEVFHGCPISKGDMVILPLVAANHDPRTFSEPDKVILDRKPNPHLAFGAGPHRCIGSHLARREMRIALEEWHKRIPDYRLADGGEPQEHGGMMGMHNLPLVW
jgi:cytochrome P450